MTNVALGLLALVGAGAEGSWSQLGALLAAVILILGGVVLIAWSRGYLSAGLTGQGRAGSGATRPRRPRRLPFWPTSW